MVDPVAGRSDDAGAAGGPGAPNAAAAGIIGSSDVGRVLRIDTKLHAVPETGRERHPAGRFAVAVVVAVVALLLALPAPPAHADSLGRAATDIKIGTADGRELTQYYDQVGYGTGINILADVFDDSASCTTPITHDCDTPTGTVELVDNGQVLATGTLQPSSDRRAHVVFELGGGPVADLDAGRHEFLLRYSGNFDPQVSHTFVLDVAKANCAITISQSSAQSTVGDPVDFVGDLGSVGHSGKVWFVDPLGTTIGQSDLFFGAVGRITIATLPVGKTDVSALYLGDTNHNSCESGFVRHTVTSSATLTSLRSSPNPSTVGEYALFTASVAGGSSTPTGTVTFSEGGTTLATTSLYGGAASFATAELATGSHDVVARYSGDSTHAPSSASVWHVVVGAPTTTAVTSSPNPSVYGQAVTLSATVAGGSSPTTGTVTFYDGDANLGTATLDANGAASVVTTSLAPGVRHIVAYYGGDATHAPSEATTDQIVHKASTTIAVTSSTNPALVGQAVTYVAVISPASASGTVQFRDGTVTIPGCAGQAVSNGRATCSTTYTSAGAHQIDAVYSGSSTHDGSRSTSLSQTVNRITTTIQLAVPDVPPVVGQPLVYTAAVSPPGATGTVLFRDGGTAIAGCSAQPVVNGEATCALTWPAPGDHDLTAAFSGDATFSPSVSASRAVRVAKAATQLTAAPATYEGRNSSVTVSARSLHALTGAPIGGQRVEFHAGSKVICTTLTDANGVARCSGGKVAVAALRSRGTYQAYSTETPNYLGASTSGRA